MPIFHSASDTSFFRFAKRLGGPTPLRRILSLMRLAGCVTIIEESRVCPQLQTSTNTDSYCRSCRDYIDTIRQLDDIEITRKNCYKLFFFKTEITRQIDVTESLQDYYLGFCVVHNDRLEYPDKKVCRAYVAECVLDKLPRDIRGYKYGNFSTIKNCCGVPFIAYGNYFSQQNGITNCCAHAAIKTALRGYFENVRCENINKAIGRVGKKLRENLGEGLTPLEMAKAITNVSDSLTTFSFDANTMATQDFLRTIYLAIESKVPVILTFARPNRRNGESHAITVTGHTFNRHNWAAYGGNYFSIDTSSYLSSWLWMDKLVIQDDNYGPMYHIEPNFFSEYIDYSRAYERYKMAVGSKTDLGKTAWSNTPLSAMFIIPKWLESVQYTIAHVEHTAMETLEAYVSQLSMQGRLPVSEDFSLFFYGHQEKMPETNEDCHMLTNKALIARTLLISKTEYLSNAVKDEDDQTVGDMYELLEIKDKVSEHLPEFFYMTEISVHELFWTNECKVGEIIIDADKLNQTSHKDDGTPSQAVRLIRFPFWVALFNDNIPFEFQIDQRPIYHPLAKKKYGLIRASQQEEPHD